MTKRTLQTIDSKIVYENPWIKIHEDTTLRTDGTKGLYAYLEKQQGVVVITLDDDNSIYLIEEYRYPIKKHFLQLPGGAAESDDLIKEAKKELLEETGITAQSFEKLGELYASPGHDTTLNHIFLARKLDKSGIKLSLQESDESINSIKKYSLPEIKDLILTSKITCGIAVASLNLLFLNERTNILSNN